MSERLEHRVLPATGSGKETGKAIALRLSHDGAAEAIAHREKTALDEVVKARWEQGGNRITVSPDLRNGQAPNQLIGVTVSAVGIPSILVNKAATTTANGFHPASAIDLDPIEWQPVKDVNLGGAFHVFKIVGRLIQHLREGSIINFWTVLAQFPNAMTPHHEASCITGQTLTVAGGCFLKHRSTDSSDEDRSCPTRCTSWQLFHLDENSSLYSKRHVRGKGMVIC